MPPRSPPLLSLLALPLLAADVALAQWDTLCPGASGGPYSAWNETRCPSASATCCASGFNPSGVGCCPFPNAVCCPGSSFACCPFGTKCTLAGGDGGYDSRYNCTADDGSISINRATCKGGPPLPMSSTLKNVLWIGDSLSLGMIPHVAQNLSDIALVQHAPWGGDGGAEETTYGLACLDFFLHSASGMNIKPDLVLFNFGMHDGPMFNETYPGQNAPPDNYKAELTQITARLQVYAQAWHAKLAFAHTTPYICTAQQDGCVQTLNHWADEVMAAAGVPVLPTYEAAIAQCGEAPQSSCFGASGCWCPHCSDAGYVYIAGNVVSPALRAMLA